MSLQQGQNIHRLTEFVPTYQPHSDFLPTRVSDNNLTEAQKWVHLHLIKLATYEQQKRLGKVYTQKPTEFNPNRYVSVRTYENVIVNKPISET
jgi:hypothetical protein